MPVQISAVVPTHNRCEVLADKLKSFRAQTLAPELFEVVVCVDGSTDGTLEMLSAYQADFELQIIHHAKPKGVVAARNACARVANAGLLLMSDDDCILSSQTLRAHVDFHSQKDKAVVGVGAVQQPGAKQRSLTKPGRASWVHATGANTSVPKVAFENVGGYDAYFRDYGGEDADLALRLREAGLGFYRVPGADVTHVGSLFEAGFEDKAFQAGRATQYIFERFATPEVGFMLGVHPVLVQLKNLAFNSPLKHLITDERRRYELAYLAGAKAKRLESNAQPHKEL